MPSPIPMALKRARHLSRKRLEQLRAEGTDLLQTQNEVLYDAVRAMSGALVELMKRCELRMTNASGGWRDSDGLCMCDACERVKALLKTHGNSILVARHALDAFMARMGQATGRKIRPA